MGESREKVLGKRSVNLWNFFQFVDTNQDLAMEASSSSDSLFDGMPDHFPDSMPSSDEVTNPSHKPHIPTFTMRLPGFRRRATWSPLAADRCLHGACVSSWRSLRRRCPTTARELKCADSKWLSIPSVAFTLGKGSGD